jgi:hypothetical protein
LAKRDDRLTGALPFARGAHFVEPLAQFDFALVGGMADFFNEFLPSLAELSAQFFARFGCEQEGNYCANQSPNQNANQKAKYSSHDEFSSLLSLQAAGAIFRSQMRLLRRHSTPLATT